MELTLTRAIQTIKSETKEIYDGLEVQYMPNGCIGTIRELVNGDFFIEWEDVKGITPIDGSEKSNSILQSCSFVY